MAGSSRSHWYGAEGEPVERPWPIRAPAVRRRVHDGACVMSPLLTGAHRQFLHDLGEVGTTGMEASVLGDGRRLQPHVKAR